MEDVNPYSGFGIRERVRQLIPASVRRNIRSKLDAVQNATFKLHEAPPTTMRLSISPRWFDFKKSGRDQMEFFTELAGLRPSDRVLDIACGVGRIAIPLSHFLDRDGGYEGFDVYGPGIEWCTNNISKLRPDFRFQQADVKTDLSPAGQQTADDYLFPYDDTTFDFAYAGSIFTHLLPKAAENYLAQTARVLRPAGRFVATWLVYNKEAHSVLGTSASDPARHWKHDYGDYRIKSLEAPEASVAYDVSFVRQLYANSGLKVLEPFRVDASYTPARIPSERSLGMHLYYALSVIATKG